MLSLGRLFSKIALVGLLVSGCSAAPELGKWQGPEAPAAAKTVDWSWGEQKASIIESKHYRIYTTIKDEEVVALLPQVMEGALSMYETIVPGIKVSDQPMECYLFRFRPEWDEYTVRYTGPDADLYRQIRSGGYTYEDKYVAYYIGRLGTFSVAAHEGWHQFAGRHFKGRMPPFFEEGMACMFETISWDEKTRLPRWNLSLNSQRAQTLRKSIDTGKLYPLDKLCAMHAGDVVSKDSELIDTFYAQSWAFARFLWEGEDGKYRPAMQKWLSDIAAGTVHDPTRSHTRARAPWNRGAVKPMLEYYLGADLKEIDKSYQVYMRKVASEEMLAQQRS